MRSLPKLRDDLVVIEQVIRGAPMFVYKVVETQNYYHLDPVQHGILSLCDGDRDASELLEEFHRRHSGQRLDAAELAEYIEGFRATDLFEVSRDQRRQMLLETIRDRRKARAASRSRYGNVFEITLPAWNPNAFFERVGHHVRFFWTPAFFWLSLISIVAMGVVWVYRWDDVIGGTVALFRFQEQTGLDVFHIYMIVFVVGFLHESAHGLTCRYFGGNVTQMGLIFIYFTPAFYVDVSDAYLFTSHFKRQWVIFAGGYFELFLCSIATFVWALTNTGTMVNDIAYKSLILTGLATAAFNFNPLIKFDGYYSLMDWLEIPDLAERSMAYFGGWFKRTFLRLPAQLEMVSRRVRRILFTYGALAVVYRLLLTFFFLGFIRNLFVESFGWFGYVLFIAAGLALFRGYLVKLYITLKFLVLDKREVLMTRQSLTVLGGSAAVALVAAVLPWFPVSVHGDFALEPQHRVEVRAGRPGFVDRILVREGDRVAAGQEIALLRNDDLRHARDGAAQDLALAGRALAAAEESGRRSEASRVRRERDRLRDRLQEFDHQVGELVLRTPIAGVVTTPRTADRLGTFLARGETFCEVSAADRLVARVPVREDRLEEIGPGQRVDLKLVAFPFRTLTGRVTAVAPAARIDERQERPTGFRLAGGMTDFEVIVALDDPPGEIRDGMTGTARIRIGRAALAARVGRGLYRWAGSRIW